MYPCKAKMSAHPIAVELNAPADNCLRCELAAPTKQRIANDALGRLLHLLSLRSIP